MADPLKIYKALADETRLRLVRLLSHAALNVNEIIGILRMGQSRISRHLKILAEAGLVSSRREGTWIYYEGQAHSPAALVAETLAHLRKHERQMPHYGEDMQGLEAVIERRREKTRTFFDNVQDPRELHPHSSLNGHFYRQVAVSLLPEKVGTVLDMGTGAGLMLPDLLGRAHRVIAVDASTTMLEMARRAVGEAGERCDFRLGDLAHLPVADGEVDAVMACMVLHHLSRPADALAEACRALAPGGQIALVDLQRHEDESLRENMADLWLGFPPEEVRTWLEENGFVVTGAEIVGEPGTLQLITFQGKKKS